ncbi:MAG: GNAT family N-acetyltransferase [Pseudomonadota bacterium]
MSSKKIFISLYENFIPSFAGAEMERLYRHIYSTLAYLKIYGDIGENTHTYVAEVDGTITAVFLFRLKQNQAQVINEQIYVDAREIDLFVRYIFATYSAVNVISFRAVQTNMQHNSHQYQRFNTSHDIVLTLPDTPEKYLASLGNSTRKNIRRHMSRLTRSFPLLRFDIYQMEEISEQHVRDIIELNRARMAVKNKASYIDEEETERIIKLVKLRGVLAILRIDGRTCAGAICFQVGKNYFSVVSGHDAQYDNYRLGTLCFYRAICGCIERGGKEFHFMWGQYEYKYQLSGIRHHLDDLMIYRSLIHLVLNSRLAVRTAYNGYTHLAKHWLLDKAREKESVNATSRLAYHFLNSLRSLKRYMPG